MKELVEGLNIELKGKNAGEVINYFVGNYPGLVTLGSSLGAEDQVLTDLLSKSNGNFSIFTLDTGRVFPETYEVLDATNKNYKCNIEVYFPDYHQVENMVNTNGVNLFYQSIEFRKECCRIRKIIPLKRALTGKKIWITGLRKDQSLNRFYTNLVEWDEGNQIIKVNPLLQWTEKDVWAYIKQNNVPYNKLHDQGFPSIGCQPCTRAVQPGEDSRSGRWWWEEPEHNECGLHATKAGKGSAQTG